MAATSIEWTDATWNPVRGCVKVSPGCANCYAETFAERFRGVKGHPYEQGFDLRLVPEKLTEPLWWKKPRRVFVNSMSDLFQDGVPDKYIDQVFSVMSACLKHTFQILTKRADRMLEYCSVRQEREGEPLPNVWLGVSVENQHLASLRVPLLVQTPAAIRFISYEPALEAVDFTNIEAMGHSLDALRGEWCSNHSGCLVDDKGDGAIDWVIVGGESGPGARPFDIAWARSIREQCRVAGVPCFVKQLGSQPTNSAQPDGDLMRAYITKKGGDMAEWPEDLRVREFPKFAGKTRTPSRIGRP